MNRSYSKIRHIQEANMLLERRRLNLILEFDQAALDKLVAETQSIASKYINSTLKLDLKDGRTKPVYGVTVYSGDLTSKGGIGIRVDIDVKKENNINFSMDFPIYSVDGVKPAGYFGQSDPAAGKTTFDTQFVKKLSEYFKTEGTNYEACKQGIWNGILAVADKYTKSGVATK